MERYNNIVRIEKIKKCLEQGDTSTALLVAETVKRNKLKSMSDLSILAEAYFQNKFYEKSKEIFLMIYEKSRNRRILAQLVHLSIKLNDVEDAEKYLKEFSEIAPKDFYRHIFRYSIDKMTGKDIEVLIEDLEALKADEYMENWAYELAKLYHKSGKKEKCIKECSDIILWFGNGIYVDKAKALKGYYTGEITIAVEELNKEQSSEQEHECTNNVEIICKEETYNNRTEDMNGPLIQRQEFQEDTDDSSEEVEVINSTEIQENIEEMSFEQRNDCTLSTQEENGSFTNINEFACKDSEVEELQLDITEVEFQEFGTTEVEVTEVDKVKVEMKKLEINELEINELEVNELKVNGIEVSELEITDPGTTDPGTTDPGTTDSGTTDPGTTDPGTSNPGTTDSGTTDPGTTDPGTSNPGTTDPGTTDPGTTDSGTTDSGTTDSGTTDSGTTDSGTSNPGATDPGTTDPGTSNPGTTDLETTVISGIDESEVLAQEIDDSFIDDIEKNILLNFESNISETDNGSAADNGNTTLKDDIEMNKIALTKEEMINKECMIDDKKIQEDQKEKENLLSSTEHMKMQINIKLLQNKYKKMLQNTKFEIKKMKEKITMEAEAEKLEDQEEICPSAEYKESIEDSNTENNVSIEIDQTKEETQKESNELLNYESFDIESLEVEDDDIVISFLKRDKISLEDIFRNFIRMEEVGKQIISCLNYIIKKGYQKCNFIISGSEGSGKTYLAKCIAKFINTINPSLSIKVAIIDAEKINRMDISNKKSQLDYAILIIQSSEKLSEKSIKSLLDLHGDESINTSVILEVSNMEELAHLQNSNAQMEQIFSERIHLKNYSINDYLGFACEYLHEKEYEITIDAYEELKKIIAIQINEKREYMLKDVFSIVHDAMLKAEQRSTKQLYEIMHSGTLHISDLLVIQKEDLNIEL